MLQEPVVKKVVRKKKAAVAPAGPRRAATLDEPVYMTLWRDLKMILIKLFHVLIPRVWSRDSQGVEALRDWDLWGPLLISLLLALSATILVQPSDNKEKPASGTIGAIFATAFMLPWAGALLIVINSMLLGGTMSFFQAVCLIGYCMFPLSLAALLSCFKKSGFIYRVVLCLVGFLWGTLSSVGFFAGLLPPHRKALGVYPVFLLFSVLAWLILAL